MTTRKRVKVHFSDFFGVTVDQLQAHGAFNVSLVNDLPLFVDPFLLFNSSKPEYKKLHDDTIRYLRFLREKSRTLGVHPGLLLTWFTFPEVRQNWFGYSFTGNNGRGLGKKFAYSLNSNLNKLFADFGQEKIARGSHLEKLCLIDGGVGRDSISDFTTNLIKEFLLQYTQEFAVKFIAEDMRKVVAVSKVRFNYKTETWESGTFDLPFLYGDYVLLTPKDILTKDDTWISQSDLIDQFAEIVDSLPNEALRAEVNNYFISQIPEKPKAEEKLEAIRKSIRLYPQLIEYYIKRKEDDGDEAVAVSDAKVKETYELFVEQVKEFIAVLETETPFYAIPEDTYTEARQRALFFKDVVENKGGHKIFYKEGQPIRNETHVHILYRLTWFGTVSDVSREVDDGRGSADFKISRGSGDKSIVEFKLASNTQLKRNLEKQAAIYQRASDAQSSIKVIVYYSLTELTKVNNILNELGLHGRDDIILVDARMDNKPSASRA